MGFTPRAFSSSARGQATFPFARKTGILLPPRSTQDNSIGVKSLDPTSQEAQAELAGRHKAAAKTVVGLLIATILLSIIAFLGKSYFRQQANPSLDVAVRIVILVMGLGSIAWRRTKFATMRLQDIASLQGVPGLVSTLEKTTVQIAFLAAAIAAIGFGATLLTGNDLYTYWAGAIAIVVLAYCYPTKSSWLRTVYRFTDRRDDSPAE